MSIKNRRCFIYLAFSMLILLLTTSFYIVNSPIIENKDEKVTSLKLSAVIPGGGLWITNPGFTTTIDPWYSSKEGDPSDVSGSFTPGQANLEVNGEKRIFSDISGIPTNEDWKAKINPLFPVFPDNFSIDQYGCDAAHIWRDGDDTNQTMSIHWEQNVTMPVDMSDYKITSASISSIYNASVVTSPGTGGGIDTPTDSVTQPGDYDTVRFYVQISDLENKEINEIAWYQTIDLGKDSGPEIATLADSFMNNVTEEALIFYLTSLFKRDSFHFKITLGMLIRCVDNFGLDNDQWNSLRIKRCDLTFAYEKIIDRNTRVSWNYQGDKVPPGDNIQITTASLDFQWKIDQPWPTEQPNSLLRVLINNNTLPEKFELRLAETEFKDAKQGGFNLTSYIFKDIDIVLSLELLILDTSFVLNRTITISIDNVFLYIFYFIITPEVLGEPGIFRLLWIAALIGAALIGGYFLLYQRILKFPVPVRKVRKYRKTLNNENPPSKKIIAQKVAFDRVYSNELNKTSKDLNVKPIQKPIEISPKKGGVG